MLPYFLQILTIRLWYSTPVSDLHPIPHAPCETHPAISPSNHLAKRCTAALTELWPLHPLYRFTSPKQAPK